KHLEERARRIEGERATVLDRAPLFSLEVVTRLRIERKGARSDEGLREGDVPGRVRVAPLPILVGTEGSGRRSRERREERRSRAIELALGRVDTEGSLLRTLVLRQRGADRVLHAKERAP